MGSIRDLVRSRGLGDVYKRQRLAGGVQVVEGDLQFLQALAVFLENARLGRVHEGDDGQGDAACQQALAEEILVLSLIHI